jgi:hypothetical protein
MKHILKLSSFILALGLIFSSCEKVGDLPFYDKGKAVTLTSSTSSVAPVPADSNNVALSFAWTNPNYAQDSSLYKFVLQIDSAGKDFSHAYETVFTGVFNGGIIAKDLNKALLNFGFKFNVPGSVDVRVLSSYGNNNERYASNVITIGATAYKVPPKIPVPANLYLVGELNGWNNSGSLDHKFYFSKSDETTYAGLFNFTFPGAYKLIQELGNWNTQYRMVVGGTATGGEFIQENSDPAFPGPSPAGWYRIYVEFQTGTYRAVAGPERVTPPAELWLVGDVNGWNNSTSLDPRYKFTRDDEFNYSIDVDFAGGGFYKLIQNLGNWGTQFHMLSGGTQFGGEFEQRDADPAFIGPSEAGRYHINVNFASNLFTVTKI